MNSQSLLTQCILPGCLCLMTASTVNAELVGPSNRGNEYLLFDGLVTIENSILGTNTLQLISDTSTWQSSNNNTAVDWKTKNIIGDPAWHSAVEVQNTISPANQIIQNTDAKLIWSDGQGTDGSNKAYFRNTFTIPTDYTITAASAKILADDFFAMSVNGHFVTNGLLDTQISKNTANNGLGLPVSVDFANWLKPGENTISIFAYDGYPIAMNDLITKDSISVKAESGKITASFTPSLPDITISDTADILGYDHFNWYQLGRFKNFNGEYSAEPFINCDSTLKNPNNPATPCTDPPKSFSLANNYYWGNVAADTEPFYWDEFESITDQRSYLNHIVDKSFQLIDQPSGRSKDFHFDTFLVGVREKESTGFTNWEPLYHLKWDKSNPSGVITYSKDDYAIDRSTIDISVQECMNGDGAKQPSPDNRTYFYDQKSVTCFRTQFVAEPPEWLLILIGFSSLFYSKKLMLKNNINSIYNP